MTLQMPSMTIALTCIIVGSYSKISMPLSEQALVGGAARVLHGLRIGRVAIGEDADPDAAPACRVDREARRFVQDDVGRLDVDPLARRTNGEQVQELDVAGAARGIAPDHHRPRARALWWTFGVECRHRPAARFDPVLVERRFEGSDRRSGHAELRIAPVLPAVGVPLPVIRQAHPASERDLAVNDQHLAVGAVVRFLEGPGPNRVEPHERDAGITQLLLRRLATASRQLHPARCAPSRHGARRRRARR